MSLRDVTITVTYGHGENKRRRDDALSEWRAPLPGGAAIAVLDTAPLERMIEGAKHRRKG